MKRKRGITIRFGPLGLSLVAAGITAVGFAAVSLPTAAAVAAAAMAPRRSRCRPRLAARPA